MEGVEKPVKEKQTATGVKDKVAQVWIDKLLAKFKEEKKANPGLTLKEVTAKVKTWFDQQPGDKHNPLLDINGLDPTQDTPVEILHTILLGIIKYVWYMLHTSMSDSQRDEFVLRLQSTDTTGLTVPPIRAAYMMQYRNNLIGKHFKTLMQTMALHVQGLVSDAHFELVKAVGHLGALLWSHGIEDMTEYLVRLRFLGSSHTC